MQITHRSPTRTSTTGPHTPQPRITLLHLRRQSLQCWLRSNIQQNWMHNKIQRTNNTVWQQMYQNRTVDDTTNRRTTTYTADHKTHNNANSTTHCEYHTCARYLVTKRICQIYPSIPWFTTRGNTPACHHTQCRIANYPQAHNHTHYKTPRSHTGDRQRTPTPRTPTCRINAQQTARNCSGTKIGG